MDHKELIPHLFRTEYSKIVAVLCTRFGFAEMELAEDIASETFMAAVQTWPTDGLPPAPTAWLYHVAKNKARNILQREAIFRGKIAPELKDAAKRESDADQVSALADDIDLSPANIRQPAPDDVCDLPSIDSAGGPDRVVAENFMRIRDR